MGLQLIVEKHILIAADLAHTADDAAALAVFDHSGKRRAFFQRRVPCAVFDVQRLPHGIAVFDEAHNDGAAIGGKSQNVGYIDGRSAGRHQRQPIVLAGFDFP
ncbi:MAG TPA: hypothetical protein VNY80_08255 [Steroidobacteraceae bacterium]|nr:hypothetical protein [Steroidobacteraceae bacterium]